MKKDKIQEYIKAGRDKLQSRTLLTREKALARLNRTVDEGSHDEASRALKLAADILGWKAPIEQNLTVTSLSPEERARRIAVALSEVTTTKT